MVIRGVLAVVSLWIGLAAMPARAAQPDAAAPGHAVPAAAQHDVAAPQAEHAVAEHVEGAHEESLLAFLARLGNFALLAGGLYYFLRTPIADYLAKRHEQIRHDLVEAAALKETATKQLSEIDARMKALPGEIDALRQRGAEEIKAEDARIRQAADVERQRLVAQTSAQIDMQLRAARRELVDLAADLAVASAKERLRAETTADDQQRLIERYVSQVRSTHDQAR